MNPFLKRSLATNFPTDRHDLQRRSYLSGQYQRERETMYSKVLRPSDVLAAGDRDDLNALIFERTVELQGLLKLHTVVRGKAFSEQELKEMDAYCASVFDSSREVLSDAEYQEHNAKVKIVPLSEAVKEQLTINGPIPGAKPEEGPSLVQRFLGWFA